MIKTIKYAAQTALLVAFAMIFSSAAAAQETTTTGSVTITASVSNFVELNSGGAVSISGNSGGGITTDGTVNSPLEVVVNIGELNPSNTNSFVKLSVPLKMRSNTAYQLSMSGSVSGAGSSNYRLKATDVGFGLITEDRPDNLANGTENNVTPGDPTIGGSTNADGRWVFDGNKSTLNAFSTSAKILSGPRINKTVPRNDMTGLAVPAIFAIKPQFYDPTEELTITANFTITAP